MEKILAGKIIFITGGTSTLGKAFVRKALGRGAEVYFTYCRAAEEAKALEREGARAFPLDLSDMRAIDGAAKEFRSRARELDMLIHNAAAVRDHSIQNMTEEEWDRVLTVDLKAPYYLTKKFLPFLFKRRPSKVLMITSRTAVTGAAGASNYAAAKAGLIGLAKSLAQELGKKEILVNALNPGFMKSRMTERVPEEIVNKHLEDSPLHCWADPEEVAEFMIYLASPQVKQVTGQVLHFESRKIS